MKLTPIELYNELKHHCEASRAAIMQAAGDKGRVMFFFINHDTSTSFKINYTNYPLEEIVEGKQLDECTEELIRRINFRERQEALQIEYSPPATAISKVDEVPPPRPMTQQEIDDEIPF